MNGGYNLNGNPNLIPHPNSIDHEIFRITSAIEMSLQQRKNSNQTILNDLNRTLARLFREKYSKVYVVCATFGENEITAIFSSEEKAYHMINRVKGDEKCSKVQLFERDSESISDDKILYLNKM